MKNSLWKSVLATRAGYAASIARIALGGVMFPHGLQKTLGLFGGFGFKGTMGFFTGNLHIPAVFALAAILAESVGALFLIAGFATRLAAFSVMAVMAVAISQHVQNGFFMNWFGNQAGEGFEFHILAIGLALVSLVHGGGAVSIDGIVVRRLDGQKA